MSTARFRWRTARDGAVDRAPPGPAGAQAEELVCRRRHSGAGRRNPLSDSRARLEQRFSAKDLARTEIGSHVICEDRGLLYEEAPQAYKNITVVIDDLVREGLAEIVAMLRPLVTYKVRR